MKFPKIDLKWVVILVLTGFLIASVSTCKKRDGEISQMQLDKQTTDSIVNQYGQTILTQEAIVTNNKQAIKDLTDSIFGLTRAQDRRIKDVIAYYKGITNTIIREVQIPYIDTSSMKEWADSVRERCSKVIEYYEANSIFVPKQAKDSTKNYSADLTAELSGITINKLEIPDSQYIRFVTIKGGLLKKDASGKRHLFTKKSIQVQVLHTNPLIQVTGQNSAIYIPPKKARWLEKTLLIGGGIFLGTRL
jgi:hypothetical protein